MIVVSLSPTRHHRMSKKMYYHLYFRCGTFRKRLLKYLQEYCYECAAYYKSEEVGEHALLGKLLRVYLSSYCLVRS